MQRRPACETLRPSASLRNRKTHWTFWFSEIVKPIPRSLQWKSGKATEFPAMSAERRPKGSTIRNSSWSRFWKTRTRSLWFWKPMRSSAGSRLRGRSNPKRKLLSPSFFIMTDGNLLPPKIFRSVRPSIFTENRIVDSASSRKQNPQPKKHRKNI